ncbi:cytochrome c [Duganella sp. Leaf126]|uniref:cytochrome c n=1 Tax=Duganella sp. Leaf126 TaxID=1736266 RepID=UPI001E62A30A|nr:cytochrome c [Duganella sp. Leaf126]
MRKAAFNEALSAVLNAVRHAVHGRLAAAAWFVLAAGFGALHAPAQATGQPLKTGATPALVERGRSLAVAGDCMACHSAPARPAYTGGLAIASPLGTIYSTNITPSVKSGIGAYTLAQFSRAVRAGVRGDGSHLYPAMPYTAYAKMTDDDTAALYAYFMHGVAADDTPAPATSLPFPFNLRLSMAVWNALYLDRQPYQADKSKSVEWNRGAYLATGLAHCATCHTPRNFLMAEKSSEYLRGGSLGTWYAPDITPGALAAAGWDPATLQQYLATGHAPNGATAGGPMREAIDKSFSRMDPQDVKAISVYLTTPAAAGAAAPMASSAPVASPATPAPGVPPNSPAPAATPASAIPAGAPALQVRPAAPAPGARLPASDIAEMAGKIGAGERLYRNNCASCHQIDGDGVRGLPALRNHPSLRHPTADNVGMAVLEGIWPEHGQGMPGFGDELTDRDVAELTNYVMATFGQSKVTITEQRVRALRAGGEPSPLLLLARAAMALGVLAIVAGLALLAHRWRQRTHQGHTAIN